MDESSIVHLMNIMIDLYEDAEMAVLREYATNALDAHIEVGNKAPIEVHLPNSLSSVLTIVDHGVGLSRQDLRDIYSKYGASTKRDTDEQTGILGLGCKSGLTYADQFTVTAVKDGMRTVAAVARDEDGAGSMQVVEHSTTDEPSGVAITIPAKKYNNFADKAAKLFRFWPEGSVLVDSRAPKRFEGEHIHTSQSGSIYLLQDTSYDAKSYVIMGNVPYPVDRKELGLDLGYSDKQQIAVFVPTGTVEFAPSRESLRMTKTTKATLERIGADFIRELAVKIQKDVEAQTTPYAALRKVAEWETNLPKTLQPDTWTYRKQEIPAVFEIIRPMVRPCADCQVLLSSPTCPSCKGTNQVAFDQQQDLIVVKHSSDALVAHSVERRAPLKVAARAYWFHGYSVKWTGTHRKKLDQWMSEQPIKSAANPHAPSVPTYYIFTEDKPTSPFIDQANIFDWEDVKAVKLPRDSRNGNGRLIGSYDVIKRTNPSTDLYPRETLASNIDQSKSIYHYCANERTHRYDRTRAQRGTPWIAIMHQFDPDATLVLMPPTRLQKFLRQFPKAQGVQDAVKARWTKWSASLSNRQKQALALHRAGRRSELARLDVTKVHDPELITAIMLAKIGIDHILKTEKVFASIYGEAMEIKLPEWQSPLIHYPLYQETPKLDHLYLYFNAAYEQFRKPQPTTQRKTLDVIDAYVPPDYRRTT
jgi:hypothetical protein